MHTTRTISSSFRCLSYSIPSTSRRSLSTTIESSRYDFQAEEEDHYFPSRYQGRMRRRAREEEERKRYEGPRPLYDPKKYMDSLLSSYSAPLPNSDSAPLPNSDSAPPPNSDSAPLPNSDSAPPPNSDSAPPPNSDSAPPPNSASAPLPNSAFAPLPASTDPEFLAWIAKEGNEGGAKYQRPPLRGTNWMGGNVPFPANPSFKPPPPLSDALKTMLYALYLSNSKIWNVRKLGEKFGISVARVEAVLRLKELEESWKKGKQLQTGFLAGMERHLHARQPSPALLSFIPRTNGRSSLTYEADEAIEALEEELNSRQTATALRRLEDRHEPSEDDWISDVDMADNADTIAREEGITGGAGIGGIIGRGYVSDQAESGVKRTFWEDVKEGNTPIAAELYDDARKAALARKTVSRTKGELSEYIVVRPSWQPGMQKRTKREVVEWKFIDVGDKFVIKRDQERRAKEKARRPRVRHSHQKA